MTDRPKKRSKEVVRILAPVLAKFDPPLINLLLPDHGKDPYIILIACLLSLRARDVVTIHVCRDLFKQAWTPQQMVDIPLVELEQIIFKTGFYRNKAKVLKNVSQMLLDRFDGKVPGTETALLSLPGVGQKTANLVLGMAFGVPAICVDTHVHRISNRLGIVSTKTPNDTEQALKEVLPEDLWIVWNELLVVLGQNICHPTSPRCSTCPALAICSQVGVTRKR